MKILMRLLFCFLIPAVSFGGPWTCGKNLGRGGIWIGGIRTKNAFDSDSNRTVYSKGPTPGIMYSLVRFYGGRGEPYGSGFYHVQCIRPDGVIRCEDYVPPSSSMRCGTGDKMVVRSLNANGYADVWEGRYSSDKCIIDDDNLFYMTGKRFYHSHMGSQPVCDNAISCASDETIRLTPTAIILPPESDGGSDDDAYYQCGNDQLGFGEQHEVRVGEVASCVGSPMNVILNGTMHNNWRYGQLEASINRIDNDRTTVCSTIVPSNEAAGVVNFSVDKEDVVQSCKHNFLGSPDMVNTFNPTTVTIPNGENGSAYIQCGDDERVEISMDQVYSCSVGQDMIVGLDGSSWRSDDTGKLQGKVTQTLSPLYSDCSFVGALDGSTGVIDFSVSDEIAKKYQRNFTVSKAGHLTFEPTTIVIPNDQSETAYIQCNATLQEPVNQYKIYSCPAGQSMAITVDGSKWGAADEGTLRGFVTRVQDIKVNSISINGDEDTELTFNPIDFTENFDSVNGHNLIKLKITKLPDNGTLKLSGANIVANQEIDVSDIHHITFTPKLDWNGNTSFKWTGSDGHAYAAITANVDITIGPVTDKPRIRNSYYRLMKYGLENTLMRFGAVGASDLLVFVIDPDGNGLKKVRFVKLPDHGTMKLAEDNIVVNQEIAVEDLWMLSFMPDPDWGGQTSFSFEVANEISWSDSINFYININATPIVGAVPKLGFKNETLTFEKADFTNQFIDKDYNDSLVRIKIVTLPVHGELKFLGNNVIADQYIYASQIDKLSFVPDENWHGYTSFMWSGYDGKVYSDKSANVDITIASDRTVTDMAKSGMEDGGVKFTTADFTSHFIDPGNIGLQKIKIMSLPGYGKLSLAGVDVVINQEIGIEEIDVEDGNGLIFRPNPNWSGRTEFHWSGTEGSTYTSKAADVNIEILPVRDNPVVINMSKSGTANTILTFTKEEFISHFIDVDWDVLEGIRITNLPKHGTLKLANEDVSVNQEIASDQLNNLTFDPGDWYGDTSFDWRGYDGELYSNIAGVNIAIAQAIPIVSSIVEAGAASTISSTLKNVVGLLISIL